jgi:choline-phosphate cytidylyltransferase
MSEKIIYTDMVADLLHYGHLDYLNQIYNRLIKNTNNKFYVGIHNNQDVQVYKRNPILSMEERIKILEYFPLIDKIIPNAPVSIEEDYIKLHQINVLCMPKNRTQEEINLMYSIPLKLGVEIEYFNYNEKISTSNIIQRIKNRDDI